MSIVRKYTRHPKVGTICLYCPNLLTNVYAEELEPETRVMIVSRGKETKGLKTVEVVTEWHIHTEKGSPTEKEGAKRFTVLVTDLGKVF